MVFPSWINWRRKKSRAARKPAGRPAVRLGVEALEERWVPSTITKVQDLGARAQALGNASSLTLTVPNVGVSAGHSIVVEVAVDQAAGSAQVSDSAGNTYSQDADVVSPIGRVRTLVFSAHGVHALAAGQAITVSLPSGSLAEAVSAAEFAGLDALNPRDQVSTDANWSFDTGPSSGSTDATAQANELVIGAIGVVRGPTLLGFLPGTGATGLTSAGTAVAHGINVSLNPEYQTVTAQGSVQATGALTAPSLWAAAAVTYRADAATHFSVTTTPDSSAGAPLTVTVTALDDTGHVVTGYTGAVHLGSTDTAAVLPADYTFTLGDGGVHTFSATLKTAGSRSITATDPLSAGLTGSAAVTVAAGAATHISLSADPSTVAGTPVSYTVTALDPFDNVATGYTGTVQVVSNDSAASLPANYTFAANDAGVHTFHATLKTAGGQDLVVTDTGNGTFTASAAVIVSPAAASHFTVNAPAGTTAGASLAFTVTALDPFNNLATGYTGTVHFGSSDGAAVVPVDYAFVATDAGVHTFGAALKTVGSRTLTATDAGNTAISGSGTVLVSPGAANHFSTSAAASMVAGAPLALTVTALDAFNNIATGYTGLVHVTSTDSAAVLPDDHAFTGLDAGVHVFSTSLKTAGNRTLTALDTVNASLSSNAAVAVTPALATHFTLTTAASTVAGAPLSCTVTALDAFNNIATGYTGMVYVTSLDAAAALPPDYTFTGNDAGVHTFNVTLKTAGGMGVTVKDAVTGSITGSAAVTVTPAAATHFSLSTPAGTTAGAAVSLTVTARDAFNNLATGYTGSAHFTSTDAAAVLPLDYTFLAGDAGMHTLNPTLKTAGNPTLTATDTANPSISGNATVTVTAAAATHFTVTAPASTTAGAPVSLTVTALDAFNNTATGYIGLVHFTSTDTAASLPADSAFTGTDAGVHTFSATLKTAGNPTVTAADSANASLTGVTAIAIAPGAATHFDIVVTGTLADAPVSVTVTARDASSNIATGYTGMVHFTSTDLGALLPADYTFTNIEAGVHTFAATFQTGGTQGLGVSDKANAGLTGNLGGILLNNPVPTLTGITPTTALEGGGNLTLTAQGGNFVHGSVLLKNGVPLATTFVSSSKLTATLTTADLAADGALTITISNPGPGGGASSAQTLSVAEASLTGSGVIQAGFEYTPLTNVALVRFTHGSNTEPGSAFSATINWGDGTTTAGTVALASSVYTVLGTHTYTDEGTFAITVTISHDGVTTTIGTTATMQEELMPDGTRGTANQRFVSEVYRDLLHRAVEAGGLQHWSSLLDQGTSRSQVVAGVEQTSEYRNVQVQELYQELLHRAADPDGLQYYSNFLAAGQSVEQVAALLATSPEYLRQKTGAPTVYVDALLQDLFGADVSAATRVSFEQLANGANSAQVAAAVFSSPDYQRHLVQGLYQHLLDRTGEDGGVNYYATELSQGMRDEQIIAQIIGGTDEFFNKTAA